MLQGITWESTSCVRRQKEQGGKAWARAFIAVSVGGMDKVGEGVNNISRL